MLTCSVCNIEGEFPTVEDLEIHIAVDHLKHLPYECEACTYARFPTEFTVRYHYKQAHNIRTRKDFRPQCIASTDASKKQMEFKAILNCSLRTTAKLQAEREAPAETEREAPAEAEREAPVEAEREAPAVSEVISEECIKQEVQEVTTTSPDVVAVEPDVKIERKEEEEGKAPSLKEEQTAAESGPATPGRPNKVLAQMPCLECGHLTSPDVVVIEPDVKIERKEEGEGKEPSLKEEQTASESGPATPGRPNKVLAQMPCLECGQMTTAQRTSFAYHVNTRHLRRPLFGCLACDKTWMTIARSDVIKHIKTAHGGDIGLIKDNRDQYNEEIRETVKAFFPYKIVQQSRTKKKDPDVDVPEKKARLTIDASDPPHLVE